MALALRALVVGPAVEDTTPSLRKMDQAGSQHSAEGPAVFRMIDRHGVIGQSQRSLTMKVWMVQRPKDASAIRTGVVVAWLDSVD
jgi:hypothetical protein